VRIVFDQRRLTFTLDTGAGKTYLYKTFADAFPSLMQLGQHRPEMTGWFQGSIDLPTVRFSLAQGVEVDLAPATVILNAATNETGWAGKFGFDLLDKALPVTIDFRAMRLSFP
jgi:hypothetical protein